MTARSGLGDRIRALREKRDWTQSELGRLTGVSQSNINLIESGRRPNISVDTLQKLARVFRVSTDEVLAYDVNAAPPPAAESDDRRRLDRLETGMRDLKKLMAQNFAALDDRLAGLPPAPTRPPKKPTPRGQS